MLRSRAAIAVVCGVLLALAACGTNDDNETGESRVKNSALDVPFDQKDETQAENGVPDVVLVGLGDSYGSGEGNPAVPTGDPDTTRWWNLTNHTSEGAELCHRSSKAAFVQAAMELQRQNPDLNIYWKHFACTGAQTEHLAAESYDATVDENDALIMDSASDRRQSNNPQFDDAVAWVNSLPWGDGQQKKIDAIYISIGGNDVGGWNEANPIERRLGLGKIIKSCIEPGVSDCDEDADTRTYIENAGRYATYGNGLTAAYTDLDARINAKASQANIVIGKKLLNAYPNLIQSDVLDPATNTNAFCGDEGEGTPSDPVGRMNNGLLANSDAGDWRFVAEKIMLPLRETQRQTAADLGWDLVRFDTAANEAANFDTFDAWTPHGLCATTNWVHDMAGAAALQGDDMDIAAWGLIATSFGAVHPNPTGWRDFANRAYYHLSKALPTSSLPSAPPATTSSIVSPGSVSGNEAPRPELPAEAAPDSAAPAVGQFATDSDGVLDVRSATWVSDASGPRDLVWSVSVRGREVSCINCRWLAPSTKRVVAAVLSDAVGDGVTSVVGFDPSTAESDFRSNGWAAEFVVGTDANAPVKGDAIQRWILECSSTCRSQELNVAEMRWANRMWSVANCDTPLRTGGPVDISDSAAIEGALPPEVREKGLDRVRLSSPHYRPILSTQSGAAEITGYSETGCES
ncbi:MAG: hypothetical protein KGQ43_00435 [Acidobacteria bacterium]|nr:hypothetical protein [Acidobacteriota bacterium]